MERRRLLTQVGFSPEEFLAVADELLASNDGIKRSEALTLVPLESLVGSAAGRQVLAADLGSEDESLRRRTALLFAPEKLQVPHVREFLEQIHGGGNLLAACEAHLLLEANPVPKGALVDGLAPDNN